jgi:molecular chaperone DnaK
VGAGETMGTEAGSTGRWVLAIDLGTTRTRAAYTSPGSREPVRVQMPPDRASSLPSSVARDPEVGGWLVGAEADPLRIGWTGAYFQNAKRLLGQPEPHYIDGHPFSILEIVAQPLIRAAALARAQARHVFDRLALAVPVEWEGVRRELIVQAGEMAGFPSSSISVTTEAEAAARAALGPAPEDGTWLLFDMGGGTLDVALLRTRAGNLQLLATFGTDQVSGYVLDTAIMEHLQDAYHIGPATPPVPARRRASPPGDGEEAGDQDAERAAIQWREILLRDTAELAKTGVTARGPGRATLPEPQTRVVLSPDTLRKLATPVIGLALEQCEDLLNENGLRWDALTAIVCAGGSTRSPVIRELLSAKAPVRDASDPPELAVVLGLLMPQERPRSAHPKTIRPANVAGVRLLQTLSHGATINALTFSPSGKYLAVASSNTVQVWDPANGTKLFSFDDHTGTVRALAFAQDGTLVSGSSDQTIRLRTPGRDSSVQVHETGTPVDSAAFSAEGALLAWGGEDAQGHLWATDTCTDVLEPFTGHDHAVVATAFAPDDSVLATAAGKVVRLWDPIDGAVRAVLAGHSSDVTALAFSPDSRRLLSASRDRTVRIWDPKSGASHPAYSVYNKATDYVRAVAFSPTGEFAASGDEDGYIRLWNPETGAELGTPSHGGYVTALSFSPDGVLIASGSTNNEVRIWGLG